MRYLPISAYAFALRATILLINDLARNFTIVRDGVPMIASPWSASSEVPQRTSSLATPAPTKSQNGTSPRKGASSASFAEMSPSLALSSASTSVGIAGERSSPSEAPFKTALRVTTISATTECSSRRTLATAALLALRFPSGIAAGCELTAAARERVPSTSASRCLPAAAASTPLGPSATHSSRSCAKAGSWRRNSLEAPRLQADQVRAHRQGKCMVPRRAFNIPSSRDPSAATTTIAYHDGKPYSGQGKSKTRPQPPSLPLDKDNPLADDNDVPTHLFLRRDSLVSADFLDHVTAADDLARETWPFFDQPTGSAHRHNNPKGRWRMVTEHGASERFERGEGQEISVYFDRGGEERVRMTRGYLLASARAVLAGRKDGGPGRST